VYFQVLDMNSRLLSSNSREEGASSVPRRSIAVEARIGAGKWPQWRGLRV